MRPQEGRGKARVGGGQRGGCFAVGGCPVTPPRPPACPQAAADGAMEPTASDVFCSRVLSMVNAEDVNAIILAQKNM